MVKQTNLLESFKQLKELESGMWVGSHLIKEMEIYGFIPYINSIVAFFVSKMIFVMNFVVSWIESLPYSIVKGIWGSEWVGLKHFKAFFSTPSSRQIIGNTLRLSLSCLFSGKRGIYELQF